MVKGMIWCVDGIPQLYCWIQISFGDGRTMEGKNPVLLSKTIFKCYLKASFLSDGGSNFCR